MEFKLSTSAHRYSKKQEQALISLGFQFNRGVITNTPIIKIKSLKELMAVVEKYGTVVLSQDEISIYDDYRE